jgi:hypothetical protein
MTANEFISSFWKDELPNLPKKVGDAEGFLAYLYSVHPELYKAVNNERKNNLDCYYDSSNLGNVIVFVINNWKKYPNEKKT